MWKLIHSKKDHQESYLFVGEEFVVGRKDASLLISADPSVSRRHAVLFVEHPERNLGDPSNKSSLFLRDEKSKYGTFLNGNRVTGQTQISHNDVIKFGQFDSEYKASQTPLVVTTSCLALPAKKELKKAIHALGGHLVSEWQPSCTHLTMTEVKVTIKALCCLLSTKPIVKPEYFQDLKKGLETSTLTLPNTYVPPIGEALIDKDEVSFDTNLERKTLFKNKTFFFLDEKQYKKLHFGILLGGGNATILTSDNLDTHKLLQDGCCVIDPTKESQSSQEVKDILPTVISTLLKKNLRLIPESDIGLSVAYCSTEKYCNPKVNIGDNFLSSKIQSQTLTQREVYVPDTEDRTLRTEPNPKNNRPSDACSSLHLSSFQIGTPVAEDIDISEIPLSAQVKRELDDIFDEPVATIPEVPVKREVTPPPSPEIPPKRQKISIFQEIKESHVQEIAPKTEVNGNAPDVEEEFMHIRPLSPKSKMPKSPPAISITTNGFSHVVEELPRNLMKIEFVSLIVSKKEPTVQQYKNSSVKNFKKFKKVLPKKAQALPRIIGAHELVPFDKAAAEIFKNEVWDEAPEEVSQPTKGEFDW